MNLSSSVRTLRSAITANSPVLLVGTAVVGVVAGGILAAKGGYKARGIIDAAQLEKVEPLTTPEKIQLTWLCYAAPAITGASTIAAVVGVHTIHNKRHAALAGLYAVTSGKLDDYREKAEELLGPKKTQDLNNAVGQKSADRAPFDNSEIIITGDGTELCQDDFSGRWFLSSVNNIEAAVNKVNQILTKEGDATVNDYYDAIGLPPITMGEHFGWSGELLEPRIGATNAPDGRSAVTAWFRTEPKFDRGLS